MKKQNHLRDILKIKLVSIMETMVLVDRVHTMLQLKI